MAQQRIFVGTLPYSATETDVQKLFAAHGEVTSVALPTDRATGRPRGFAFVEMSSGDATKAIAALDGTDMDGRALSVSVARERGDRGPRGDGGGRGDGGSRGGGYGSYR